MSRVDLCDVGHLDESNCHTGSMQVRAEQSMTKQATKTGGGKEHPAQTWKDTRKSKTERSLGLIVEHRDLLSVHGTSSAH